MNYFIGGGVIVCAYICYKLFVKKSSVYKVSTIIDYLSREYSNPAVFVSMKKYKSDIESYLVILGYFKDEMENIRMDDEYKMNKLTSIVLTHGTNLVNLFESIKNESESLKIEMKALIVVLKDNQKSQEKIKEFKAIVDSEMTPWLDVVNYAINEISLMTRENPNNFDKQKFYYFLENLNSQYYKQQGLRMKFSIS